MSETTMPAIEVSAEASERELVSYELAFHVLPTIAEGEVPAVFQKVKDIITKRGGELTLEEAPARFDLEYEIVKYLEGRNRKFGSAYFGWVRFNAEPAMVVKITRDVEGVKEFLRHLLIKLTKVEEVHPFYFHEALVKERRVETIDVDALEMEEEGSVVADEVAPDALAEDGVEVKDKV